MINKRFVFYLIIMLLGLIITCIVKFNKEEDISQSLLSAKKINDYIVDDTENANYTIGINAPHKVFAGETVVFRAFGEDKEWYWDFEDGYYGMYNSKYISYTFYNAGKYIVKLYTERTAYPIIHNIEVLENFEFSDTDGKLLIVNDIKDKLQNIADGLDFNLNYNYLLNNYLAGNKDVLLIVENKGRNDFYSYCHGLKFLGNSNLEITKVEASFQGNTNIIKQLKVYEKD